MNEIMTRFRSEKNEEEIFYHLCFCLTVPQGKHKTAKEAIEKLKEVDFFRLEVPLEEVYKILAKVRFGKIKSDYLLRAKVEFPEVLKLLQGSPNLELRRTLISKIKGMGPKVASHFLRNCGFTEYGILDVHSLRFLKAKRPHSIAQYEEVEQSYKLKAQECGLSVAELDIKIWQEASGTSDEDFIY